MRRHSARARSTAFAFYAIILPLLFVIPASQMLRACSYEVAGDMTSPRLASLIERARTASVPKVSHQHASHPHFAPHYFSIQNCNSQRILTDCSQTIIERAVAKGLGLGKGGEEACSPCSRILLRFHSPTSLSCACAAHLSAHQPKPSLDSPPRLYTRA